MYAFPMTFTDASQWDPDESGVVVACADLPELQTAGDDMSDALSMARDALALVLQIYVEDKRPVPAPSAPRKGEVVVEPDLVTALRTKLYEALRDRGVTQVALAERMGTNRRMVARLLDWKHNANPATLADALRALDYRLDIRAVDTAPRAA